MTLYAIEYEVPDGAAVPRLGHVTIAAPSAQDALEEFQKNHPDTEVVEMRRTHA